MGSNYSHGEQNPYDAQQGPLNTRDSRVHMVPPCSCVNERRLSVLEKVLFGNGREGMQTVLQKLGYSVDTLLSDMKDKKDAERARLQEYQKLKWVIVSAFVAQFVALIMTQIFTN